MSVIESLQTQTKEMEENAISEEEMLKTNEKTEKGEYAEDDNSNDDVDDLNYPEKMDTCYFSTPHMYFLHAGREPRGFGFAQFVEPADAQEA
ncbi:hypothetical protein Tco_1476692, partial [Tanacetum coccineum]